MYRQEKPEESSRFLSPRHSRQSPPKHPVLQYIASIQKQQTTTFSVMDQKCSALDYAIANLQDTLLKLGGRVQHLTQQKQAEMLGSLKMKQYQFIIGELRNSVSKQNKKQERLQQDLDNQKKRGQKQKQEIFRLQAKTSTLIEKVARLEGQIRDKNLQIESLNCSIHQLRGQYNSQPISKGLISQSKLSIHGSQEYIELQQKLQELQKQFNIQIQKLVGKNSKLAAELKRVQQECQDARGNNKVLKRQLQEMSIMKYQHQIKLKQQVGLCSQLQENYKKIIQKTNNNQINLHKQIQQFKTKENQIRMEYKKEKKNLRQYISNIADFANFSAKYYFSAHSLQDQIEEIKHLIEKNIKKKVQTTNRELQFYKTENNKLKIKIETSGEKIQELEKKQAALKLIKIEMNNQKDDKRQNSDKGDKNSDNGSFMNNRSSEKSEDDKFKGVEEKYRSKLQLLRKDVKAKQVKINQLQRLQQSQFDKGKQKILELEQAISQKCNSLRRSQLKIKQKQEEIAELKNTTKEFQGKLAALNERIQNQKESNNKLIQMKVVSYQQKLKTLKSSYKEIEKKQQQKTLKYNKLKSKSQKYQIEVSESLKRKNGQIQQLLKENNKLKVQNKLLQEKININQIIEGQDQKNKTPGSALNQDLIEQIEMQRDRISGNLAQKEQQLQELMDSNSKLSGDLMILKKQTIQYKMRIEDLSRSEKILTEQNKFLKEKIEQLNNQSKNQNEEKHIYFKKQLQKAISAQKKLQKNIQKMNQQKDATKKETDEKINQLSGLKNINQKLKQKNIKLSNQNLQIKQNHKKIIIDFERKLSECATKEEQLITIINYKNREGTDLRDSMKGQELIIEQQAKIKFNKQTNTDVVETQTQQINTDPIIFENKKQRKSQTNVKQNQIIPSQMILEAQDFEIGELRQNSKELKQLTIKKEQGSNKAVNYFSDLVMQTQNMDDHFQICEEGEQINIGQTSMNLQIKQIFNALRKQIEKVFNQEDISITTLKMLPKQLEDDFTQFVSYIKQKIFEIKGQNNLSFIMAEAGNEPQIQDIEIQLLQFMSKESYQYLKLRKIIQEKDSLLTSLMNEKTQQQNTINQLTLEKEETQEENENRFMNQCNVYKKEIKQHKKLVDLLEMNCQSLKNIFKNMFEIWLAEGDNEDDLRDNLMLYSNICKLNEQEKRRVVLYVDSYKKFKKIK